VAIDSRDERFIPDFVSFREGGMCFQEQPGKRGYSRGTHLLSLSPPSPTTLSLSLSLSLSLYLPLSVSLSGEVQVGVPLGGGGAEEKI
jgi:hypothetical protein